MKLLFNLSGKLNWLYHTLYFIKKHFVVIVGLGLIAAFGRVIQLGGFGEITSRMNFILEIVIESARVLIFLYVLGLASIKNGVLQLSNFFTGKINRKLHWAVAIQKMKEQWLSILLSVIGFLLIAGIINYLIDLLAWETCLYLTLKKDGILAGSSSEWTILLFFKNISIIPFMLVFQALFLLWITNKFQNPTTLIRNEDSHYQ